MKLRLHGIDKPHHAHQSIPAEHEHITLSNLDSLNALSH